MDIVELSECSIAYQLTMEFSRRLVYHIKLPTIAWKVVIIVNISRLEGHLSLVHVATCNGNSVGSDFSFR